MYNEVRIKLAELQEAPNLGDGKHNRFKKLALELNIRSAEGHEKAYETKKNPNMHAELL